MERTAALWKLVRDPVFIECLQQSKKSGLIGVYPQLLQVLCRAPLTPIQAKPIRHVRE
jgi:hypothetical protein